MTDAKTVNNLVVFVKNGADSVLEFEAATAGSDAHADLVASMALCGEWERIPTAKPRLSADARRWLNRFAVLSGLDPATNDADRLIIHQQREEVQEKQFSDAADAEFARLNAAFTIDVKPASFFLGNNVIVHDAA